MRSLWPGGKRTLLIRAQGRSVFNKDGTMKDKHGVFDPVTLPKNHFRFLGVSSQEEYESKLNARVEHKKEVARILEDPSISGVDKQDAQCRYTRRWGKALLSCQGCWLLPGACICSRMKRYPSSVGKVVVLMTEHEWGRASNSGSIASSMLEGAEILMKGMKSDDARLKEIISDPSMTTAVLWPSDDALTATELRQGAAEKTAGRVCIIALDGTWGQARRLIKSLSGVPLVKLSSAEVLDLQNGQKESLLAPVRRYNGSFVDTGRVSTLEAIVALLREAGESPEVCDALLDTLKLKVDSLRIQSHKSPAFDTLDDEELKKFRGWSGTAEQTIKRREREREGEGEGEVGGDPEEAAEAAEGLAGLVIEAGHEGGPHAAAASYGTRVD